MSVMAASKAFIVLVCSAFAFNEANALELDSNQSFVADLHKLRPHFERSEHSHARSMDAIMQRMTSHDALEILRRNEKASPELLALAQTAVSHKRLRSSMSAKPYPSGMSSSDGAKFMVNKLIEETMKKYDLEMLKCRDYYTKQCGMIEESRGVVASSNFKGASCRTHILAAQTAIGSAEAGIPPTQEAMKDHKAKCKAEVGQLHTKLKSIQGDIDVMTNILGMTDCGSSFIQTGQKVGRHVGLLHCKRECDKTSLLTFDHSPLRKHVEMLKSHVAQELLQQSFQDLADQDMHLDDQVLGDLAKNITKFRRTMVPASPCVDPNQGAPSPVDKRAAKCTITGTVTCNKLQERFTLLQAGLQDGEDSAKSDVVDVEERCKDTEVTLSRAVEKAEQNLKTYQTKLAEATGCENEAAESGRLANKEYDEMTGEIHAMKNECSANYQNSENELCGLKKIRAEIYIKMKGTGKKPFFLDCKLSDWTPGECSVECGGGVQQMTRTVDTQPIGGAQCLPLSEMRRCNEQPCPVDCKLGTWSGWSSCSAECGGGVEQRLRDVVTNMRHNGQPCGAISETKACNVQACEKECELSDWSGWTQCSKACDGGTRKRLRHVAVSATGGGECAKPDSDERRMFKKCNSHACPKAVSKKTLTCEAKIDLILALDGSGSLGKEGWKATRRAAEMIVESLDNKKAQVAVLLFSGPKTWKGVKKCFASKPVDQELACKLKWVQHMSTNIKQTLGKIKFLDWPKGSTLTSLALMGALGETQLGRQDAETVVTVITDGKPMSKRRTKRAAKAVRKVARLMWVPVTKRAPLRMIRRMATSRWQENVIPANDFAQLEKPDFVNHIIADMCPQLKP